jgi:hypothetical protein
VRIVAKAITDPPKIHRTEFREFAIAEKEVPRRQKRKISPKNMMCDNTHITEKYSEIDYYVKKLIMSYCYDINVAIIIYIKYVNIVMDYLSESTSTYL